MSRITILAACAFVASGCTPVPNVPAAPTLAYLPALSGDYFSQPSRTTGRTYHIYVRLPQDYAADPARRYPVVYLLDGDSLFPILGATHLFLTLDDKLPEAIVVGIAYGGFGPVNKRGIDYRERSTSEAPGEAGAAAFLSFLKGELIPAVETRYRADPARRILFGQSLGGRFAIHSAFVEPDMFWGRIASNPALTLTYSYEGEPARAVRSDLALIVTSGTNDRPELRTGTSAWIERWKPRRDLPWRLHAVSIAGGTHAANSTDAYRAGMRLLFKPPER
ncbi:alpha/beta hydrolase [Sphingomonas sp. LT1P40]|uniref:alpha/beta hydrolase n=1 Tax=Alteristakelama amylovorans TaxID=3096166 RepID=UPI002FC82266